MLIVSHNLVNHDFPIPKDAIFRINLAWISNLEILKEILEKHKNDDIFLDLPKNTNASLRTSSFRLEDDDGMLEAFVWRYHATRRK